MENNRPETWTEIELKVLYWAQERKLINRSGAPKQMIKVMEEVGELAREVLKADTSPTQRVELKDAIGDVLVTIIILTTQLGLDTEDCLLHAYNEISGRTGKTINGIFVKD